MRDRKKKHRGKSEVVGEIELSDQTVVEEFKEARAERVLGAELTRILTPTAKELEEPDDDRP